MTTRPICFMLLCAAAVAWSPCPAAAAEKPGDDVQDFVFLSTTRPVFVRLHVRIDGKPFRHLWDDYTQKLFEYLDVNGDGVLSKEEAARVPSTQFLRDHLQGFLGFPREESAAPLAQLDSNKDGQVSREELVDYYRRAGFVALQLRPGQEQGTSEALTEALFRHLDEDKDGKLSKEETAKAVRVLHKLDLNEDEMVTKDELAPHVFGNPRGFRAAYDPDGRLPGNADFVMATPGDPPARLTRQFLGRYDKNKDGKLSLAEAGLEKETFAALDKNGDGELDQDELARFLDRPADLELVVRLGGKRPAEVPEINGLPGLLGASFRFGAALLRDTPVAVFNPEGRAMVLAPAVQPTRERGLRLTLDGTQTEVRRGPGRGENYYGTRQFYLQQFKIADSAKKGYLEAKQVQQSQFLGPFMKLADRDGDGKLTEKELVAFLDLHDKAAVSRTVVTFQDKGRGLFELLDADGDGRLSVRELRTAWDRLAALDRDKAGKVERSAISRHYQATLTLGEAEFPGRVVNTASAGPGRPRGRGPAWFQKMDTNGDGDVSLREFLGSEEEFKRLDADGDGLISVQEAEQAEVPVKKQKEGGR